MSLSTHVLDIVLGRPARGLAVRLDRRTPGGWEPCGAAGPTDADGRRRWEETGTGTYRLVFDTRAYFAARGVETLYPEVGVTVDLATAPAHHHVPLLLAPFAYSTYRGS